MALQTPIANTAVYKVSFFPQTIRDCRSTVGSLLLQCSSGVVRHPKCCSTPQGFPGVGHNTLFLSSPHLCFIIVFICDLFVSRDDPLMG